LGINSALLHQLSYPGMATWQASSACTRPITVRVQL
ncbi:MAG: hypothetical protein QOK06_2107, partial [Acidimicrobiaceae bacterium]